MSHKHEWLAMQVTSGSRGFARCKAIECHAELTAQEVDARLNATEELTAEDARVITRGIEVNNVNFHPAWLTKLRAYANKLEEPNDP